jgi:hypothetical protein
VDQPAELERALRRCLRRQAAGVRPSGADLAGRSLRSGRRRRALGGTAGLAAVILLTVLASGVLLHGSERASPAPVRGFAYPVSGLDQLPPLMSDPVVPELGTERQVLLDAPVGLVGRDEAGRLLLVSGSGRVVDLRYLSSVTSAHPVGDGWAVVAGGQRATLWWVDARQRPRLVLGSLDGLAVDGSRVAWRRDNVLSAARLSHAGELEQQVDTSVADRGVDPYGFVGDRVLLAHIGPERELAAWDTWRPDTGAYVAGPAAGVEWVFGALPGGEAAVGLAPVAGAPCLARLDAQRGLAVEVTACLPELPAAGPAAISPDGRWLLGSTEVGGDGAGSPLLVDLTAAFDGDAGAVRVVTGAPGPVGSPIWTGIGSAAYLSGTGAFQLWPELVLTGAPGAVESLDLPSEPLLVFALA